MTKGFFVLYGDYDALQEALKRADLPQGTIAAVEVIDEDREMSKFDFEVVGESAGLAVWRGIQADKQEPKAA